MGITQDLAKYCNELKYRKLPEEVIDRANYFFLDFIGVACCGSQAESSKSMYRFVREMGQGNGVLIGTKTKASFLYSTLANGAAGHAIEMDDVHNESSLHPGVVVFPSALATGERMAVSGKSFIEAVLIGYEVMVRLGKAIGPGNSYARGFHPTATCGTFGSNVVASKMMGLKTEKMVSALGIAGSQAAGSMEYLAQGAQAGTHFNIMLGLCIGHDSLFLKFVEGLTTVFAVKDRVTGHNPIAALYTSKSYYQRLMKLEFGSAEEMKTRLVSDEH